MTTTGVLSLGPNRAANSWTDGCNSLGIKVLPPNINREAPTLDELLTFFKSSPDWIYFAGHHLDNYLYGFQMSVRVEFDEDKVTLFTDRAPLVKGRNPEWKETVLEKGTDKFKLDVSQNLVVLWGGCSVCSDRHPERITSLFSLFGPHVLLGFSDMCGIDMVDVLLGGKATIEDGGTWTVKKNFFANLQDTKKDAEAVRNAWLQAAVAAHGGTALVDRFRAIDPDGQEWKITKKEIVKGRKIPVLHH